MLRDENDDDSVIPQITPEEFKQYVADGVIQGGMIPKLENSFGYVTPPPLSEEQRSTTALKSREGKLSLS